MKSSLGLALLFLLLPLNSHAAQDAMITQANTAVRERPDQSAPTIENKQVGEKVRISSQEREGWYKVKATNGKFGWIWQADLAVLNESSDVKAANLELTGKKHERRSSAELPSVFLRLGGVYFPLTSSTVSHKFGMRAFQPYHALGGFAELSFRIEESLRLALRMATYSATTNGPNNYSITHTGLPLLAGLETDVTRTEFWDISAGFYAGWSLNNSLSITASDFEKPNSFKISGPSYAALVNFTAKYWVSRSISFVAETGVFYTRTPAQRIAKDFNGSAPFKEPEGSLVELPIQHVGPMFSLGMQFAL